MSTSPGPFNPGQAIREALALHRQGRLDHAEKLYARVLKAQRDNFDALHLLGMLNHQRGKAGEAYRLITAALKVLAAPFKVLDAAVSKEPYLLGGEFTVADLNVAAVISRAIEMDLSATPNLKAWLTRCLERPAARQALALKTTADNATPVEVTRRIARINRL